MLTHVPTGPADPMDPFESEPHSGLVWFAEECMNNGAPLERYIVHAESIGDRELATFFRRALAQSRRARPGDRRRSSRRGRGDRRRR
ncbi:MAG TPA: hypothetical protein VMG37_17605 [Solirubrobacteraceae bacterium]|nr:hypothetical protein [Solirubrobacteraceae bacterium]